MPEEKIEEKKPVEETVVAPAEEPKPKSKRGKKIDLVAEMQKPAEEKKEVKKLVKKRVVAKPIIDVEDESLLIPVEDYLKAGIHIGSQYKSGDMARYIYKTRGDGLHVLDVKTVNERLKMAGDFLANYEPAKILVVAGRVYARKPARKFAENVGALLSVKRFVPGTLTNPKNPNFVEPDVVLVSDPGVDKQAVTEAKVVKIPVVALCDTNNVLRNIDVSVPLNNKGKKSLALAYWLLTREVLVKKKLIKASKDFTEKLEDFESGGK